MPASQMASGRHIAGSCLYVQSQQPEMLSSTGAMLWVLNSPCGRGRGAVSGSHRGFCKAPLLTHTTNASWPPCSQPRSLFLPAAVLASPFLLCHQLSRAPHSPPALCGGLACDPPGTDLVSDTSAGSPDLHFSPFEGTGLGEARAETLNRFVLICFMILLGAVFTQIQQASGLDNLLEISGV